MKGQELCLKGSTKDLSILNINATHLHHPSSHDPPHLLIDLALHVATGGRVQLRLQRKQIGQATVLQKHGIPVRLANLRAVIVMDHLLRGSLRGS